MKPKTYKISRVAPDDEQRICFNCGFCCDGTLFLRAHLNKNEIGRLPDRIERNRITDGEKEYFRLPCEYYNGCCTIYGLKRADICYSFRCGLLKLYSDGKISLNDALRIVDDAVKMRNMLINSYKQLSGNESGMPFRQLLTELGNQSNSGSEYDLFLARCNIFEALLIKFFRSEKEFTDIMVK